MLFNKRALKSAPVEPCEGAETDSRAKFHKGSVVGAHRRPKWAAPYGVRADSGRTQDTQALLRLAQARLG